MAYIQDREKAICDRASWAWNVGRVLGRKGVGVNIGKGEGLKI